jgi:hypothetical protein
MTAIVRYNTRTMEFLGVFTMEKLVRYSTLSYRIAIVWVLWRTIAQNPGTVRLCCVTVGQLGQKLVCKVVVMPSQPWTNKFIIMISTIDTTDQ